MRIFTRFAAREKEGAVEVKINGYAVGSVNAAKPKTRWNCLTQRVYHEIQYKTSRTAYFY